MISPEQFIRRPTLSLGTQPYLRQLFDALAQREPLTLVIGAGVSMNSGLPSWPRLIANMGNKVEDPSLHRLLAADSSDPIRKAEITLQLIRSTNRNRMEFEFIRDALYPEDLDAVPGPLALAIARLIKAKHRRQLNILTTNFDTMFERALGRYFDKSVIESHSLETLDRWKHADSSHIAVMHLHGLVPQQDEAKNPIVITESQFLQHGAQVRDVISECLGGSTSIFVGLSMSDPNLIGPLYQSRESQAFARYALFVPDSPSPHASPEDAARYAIQTSAYHEQTLGLRPIFLKSYSQLNQVFSELAFSAVEPKRHRRASSDHNSLSYGNRLMAALDQCYSAIGCEADAVMPEGGAAFELSGNLHRALRMPGGPEPLLRAFEEKYDLLQESDPERFALFLWLRVKPSQPSQAAYHLTVVGTSAYAHREGWSLRRDVEIARNSEFPAAEAVFSGTTVAVNVDRSANAPIWSGIVATPIFAAGSHSTKKIGPDFADILPVGAITLNSTRPVAAPAQGSQAEGRTSSIVRRLESADFNSLIASLAEAARVVLQP